MDVKSLAFVLVMNSLQSKMLFIFNSEFMKIDIDNRVWGYVGLCDKEIKVTIFVVCELDIIKAFLSSQKICCML